MTTAYVLKGHVNPDGIVVSDETAPLPPGPVEMTVQACSEDRQSSQRKNILDVLDSLPPGTRSSDDIDGQLKDERDSWNRA